MMREVERATNLRATHTVQEAFMWYAFGGLAAVLWLVLIITLGLSTLRNGHIVLFILGFFLPFLWLIGAISRPKTQPV